eukprot:5778669-Pleurochrysis_carterae.AAC.4
MSAELKLLCAICHMNEAKPDTEKARERSSALCMKADFWTRRARTHAIASISSFCTDLICKQSMRMAG